jgi:eukaryotic-like serine/threonine-protein kinase
MDEQVSLLFREVADLPPAAREKIFAARNVTAEVRAEIESLLAFDSEEDHFMTDCVGHAAESIVRSERAPSLAGQVVGSYTLKSPIGQGGMGTVWLAQRSDGRFEGQAAVKFLHAALMGQAGEERFQREGSVLARLAHPHIARLIDAGVSHFGQPYLVLEHVQGEPIDRYCDARGLAAEDRIRLFLDVLEAVAHAHSNLIVHRDIKASNVLVTPEGSVKLLDFGIAKLLEDSEEGAQATALTREGGVALTPEFAAPEQVMGGAITTATDVYSAGVLLFQLLGGKRPGGSPAEIMRAVVEAELPKLAAPRDLATIVAKALKREPAERYASAAAFAADLRHYLANEPIAARPDTLGYRTSKFLRRRWRVVTAVSAATLLIMVLTGFYTARLATERNHARLEAQKATKVSDLLISMLTASDPFVTHEVKEPTVRSLLDSGATRVHQQLAGEPELEAEMLTVIGRVYERLGADDKAQGLLEEALAIGRRGPRNETLAGTLNDLGVLLKNKGQFSAAVPLLEEALAIRRKLLGNEHADVEVTVSELGRLYTNEGDLDRAEPYLTEALRIRRKIFGEEHTETATTENDLALVLRLQGKLSEAAALLQHSLAAHRKEFGEDHASVARVMSNLAVVEQDIGELAAAESLARQSLTIRRRVLDKHHPDIGRQLCKLGDTLREEGKYEESTASLREALEIVQPALGDAHPLTAECMADLAYVYFAQGQAASAEPLVRKAVETRRRLLRAGNWQTASSESLLGGVLTALGKYGEAEPLLLSAQRALKDIQGAQAKEVRANKERLARLQQASHSSNVAPVNSHLP